MTGAILAQMKDVLAGLEVHADRMRNLDALGGFLLSERVMFALADKIGKQTAHEVVYEASMQGFEQGITFEHALMANPRANQRARKRRTAGAARSDHLCRACSRHRRPRSRPDPRIRLDQGRLTARAPKVPRCSIRWRPCPDVAQTPHLRSTVRRQGRHGSALTAL